MSTHNAKKTKTIVAVEQAGPYTVEVTGSAKGAGDGSVQQREKAVQAVRTAAQHAVQQVQMEQGERLTGQGKGTKRTRGGKRRARKTRKSTKRRRMTRRR